MRNWLTLPDAVALLHKQALSVGVSRYPPICMTNENEIAKAGQFVAGINHLAGRGGADINTCLSCDIETVILLAGGVRAIGS